MTFRIHAHANGTYTMVDTTIDQAMHSRIGPELEANLVYSDAAKIETALISGGSVHTLYDVGMGTAANVAAVLARLLKHPEALGTLRIFSFESKPDGLRTALENLEAFPLLREWDANLRALLGKSESRFKLGNVEIDWRLLVGDFYDTVASAPLPDTIFFDFYSPKVVPELWSLECFELLRKKIGPREVRLFTYSAATPVRLHLLAAGFFVGSGASTGVKTETTVAATRIDSLANPLPRTWLGKLDLSASISGPEHEAAKSIVRAHPQWRF